MRENQCTFEQCTHYIVDNLVNFSIRKRQTSTYLDWLYATILHGGYLLTVNKDEANMVIIHNIHRKTVLPVMLEYGRALHRTRVACNQRRYEKVVVLRRTACSCSATGRLLSSLLKEVADMFTALYTVKEDVSSATGRRLSSLLNEVADMLTTPYTVQEDVSSATGRQLSSLLREVADLLTTLYTVQEDVS